MSGETKRFGEFRIYRPNKSHNGSASKIQLKIKTDGKFPQPQMFWITSPQTGVDENGNASFAWDDSTKSVTMKLGITDLGELLSVIQGRKKETQLFHQNPKGNTVLKINKSDKDGYYFNISSKRGNNLIQLKHTLTHGEVSVLQVLLQHSILIFHQYI